MVCNQIESEVMEFFGIAHIVSLYDIFEQDALNQGSDVTFRVDVLYQDFRISPFVQIFVQQVKDHALAFFHVKGLIYYKIPRSEEFRKRKWKYLELDIAACQVGGKFPAQEA